MATDREILKELEKAKEQTIDIAQTSIDTQKEIMQDYMKMVDKYADASRDYMEYVASDVLATYDKLIMLRTECIDKYINFLAMLFQDNKEFDVSIPTKRLMDKKYGDITAWQDELKPLKELLKFDENTTDKQADELLEVLKNI